MMLYDGDCFAVNMMLVLHFVCSLTIERLERCRTDRI